MLRYWSFLFAFLLALPVPAATIAPSPPATLPAPALTTPHPFQDVVIAQTASYRDSQGPASFNLPLALAYLFGLLVYAIAFVTVLPRCKSHRYAAWAAAAMSRIRWTMARTPFDR